jgi:hypothetical protein
LEDERELSQKVNDETGKFMMNWHPTETFSRSEESRYESRSRLRELFKNRLSELLSRDAFTSVEKAVQQIKDTLKSQGLIESDLARKKADKEQYEQQTKRRMDESYSLTQDAIDAHITRERELTAEASKGNDAFIAAAKNFRKEALKKKYWKKKDILVPLKGGEVKSTEAWTYDGLAVHKEFKGSYYSVTHINSGLSLKSGFRKATDAKVWAFRVAHMMDWSRTGDEILEDGHRVMSIMEPIARSGVGGPLSPNELDQLFPSRRSNPPVDFDVSLPGSKGRTFTYGGTFDTDKGAATFEIPEDAPAYSDSLGLGMTESDVSRLWETMQLFESVSHLLEPEQVTEISTKMRGAMRSGRFTAKDEREIRRRLSRGEVVEQAEKKPPPKRVPSKPQVFPGTAGETDLFGKPLIQSSDLSQCETFEILKKRAEFYSGKYAYYEPIEEEEALDEAITERYLDDVVQFERTGDVRLGALVPIESTTSRAIDRVTKAAEKSIPTGSIVRLGTEMDVPLYKTSRYFIKSPSKEWLEIDPANDGYETVPFLDAEFPILYRKGSTPLLCGYEDGVEFARVDKLIRGDFASNDASAEENTIQKIYDILDDVKFEARRKKKAVMVWLSMDPDRTEYPGTPDERFRLSWRMKRPHSDVKELTVSKRIDRSLSDNKLREMARDVYERLVLASEKRKKLNAEEKAMREADRKKREEEPIPTAPAIDSVEELAKKNIEDIKQLKRKLREHKISNKKGSSLRSLFDQVEALRGKVFTALRQGEDATEPLQKLLETFRELEEKVDSEIAEKEERIKEREKKDAFKEKVAKHSEDELRDMGIYRIKSSNSMSNAGLHRSGGLGSPQSRWWLRSEDGEFVTIPSVRGDQIFDEYVEVPPGRYTLGTGKGDDAIREVVVVGEAKPATAPAIDSAAIAQQIAAQLLQSDEVRQIIAEEQRRG